MKITAAIIISMSEKPSLSVCDVRVSFVKYCVEGDWIVNSIAASFSGSQDKSFGGNQAAVRGCIDRPPDVVNHFSRIVWIMIDKADEEDEEIFRHPRNPYKRVDAIRSSRHVEVIIGGTRVADTRRAVFLFETGLPTRYYIPRDDVLSDVLGPSERHTQCPYKGVAAYHTVTIGGERYGDLVWYYPDPIDECRKITGRLAFFNEKVDAIFVDGEVMPRSVIPWSVSRQLPK